MKHSGSGCVQNRSRSDARSSCFGLQIFRPSPPKLRKVYPEVEYIEYDVDEMGEPCFIEPHVDNKSAAAWRRVSGVALVPQQRTQAQLRSQVSRG